MPPAILRPPAALNADLERTIVYLRKAQKDLRDRQEELRVLHEQMSASQARYRDLFDAAPIGYLITDLSSRIVESNRIASRMLAVSSSGIRGQRFEHFVALAERPRVLAQLSRCRRGRPVRPMEVHLRRENAGVIPTQVALLRAKISSRSKAEMRIIIVDLTDLKSAQAALEASRQTLERRVEERTRELTRLNHELASEIARRTQLEGQLLEISERERRRFGQDLHDETCQAITGHALELATLSQRLVNEGVELAPEFRKLAGKLNQLAENARRIAHSLHPVALGGGLVAALEDLAIATSQKLRCILRAQDPQVALSPEVELALYRIAQEALTNTVKHSDATRVVVRLQRSARRIALSIEDNGVGLPQPMPEKPSGMSLDILGYRARSIGAQLTIESVPQGGVRVTCHLPNSALGGNGAT